MSNAAASEKDLADRFWKALKSDMMVMLGLSGVEEGHAQPMTAQLDGDQNSGPIWFFTPKDTDLVKAMGQGHRAVAHFVSKGHDLFASVNGELVLDNDRATLDRLWNRSVAAWFQGKDDPNLQLIRLDPERAQIWRHEHSLLAGVKLLMGSGPKEEYKNKMADVNLSRARH